MPSVSNAPSPDPLQQSYAYGTSLGEVDPTTVGPEMKTALTTGADVPERVQSGPTCGLYALGMVMDYFEQESAKNLNPLVQKGDSLRPDAEPVPPNTQELLLDTAQKDGFSTQGEMFRADQLGALAQQFGYQSKVEGPLTVGSLEACLSRKHPALVAFDVDMKGDPGIYGGARAHWCVVEGMFQKNGVDYVVATHGWEGKEYVWRAQDLIASSDQLHVPNFPGAPSDISQTLANRLVEVAPR